MGQLISSWDVFAIVAYFLIVIAVGFYAMYKANRGTISGYFLAGRFMTWLPVGASLFASNIGSEHFIGLAGSGAAAGIGVGAFELNALIILQVLGWFLLPVYIASGVHTLPEFMKKRFGGDRIRFYLACLSLLLYVLTKISVNMYSGSLFIQKSLGWNLYLSIVLILAITTFCTITGGLTAVLYTDTIQCFLMIFGASGLAIYVLVMIGGYHGLVVRYMSAIPNETLPSGSTCGHPTPKSFTMLRDPGDPDLPWLGFLLGQSPASIWYWAADQMMVQRTLSSKSLSHAQGATLFAGYLKILPLFIIVLPGMASRCFFTNEIACVNTCEQYCGNPVSCSNMAYPNLVTNFLPEGVRGIMLAVMLAALMSDLTSIFNSAATLFSMDIWHRFRKAASQKELLIVGRVWVIVMVVISILWVPVVVQMQGGQLFIYIQSISAYLAPPIAAVYLLAIFWKRCNEKAAFWSLMAGLMIGFVRMALDFVYAAPKCGEPDTRPMLIGRMHYMYFALMLFWITILVAVVISYITPPLEPYRTIRTTYWTRHDASRRPDDVTFFKVEPPKDGMELRSISNTSYRADGGMGRVSDIRDTRSVDCSKGVCYQLKRSLVWFCGLEESSDSSKKHVEDVHVHDLAQSSKEKWILNLNLVLLLSVAVFLYVFFSAYSPVVT